MTLNGVALISHYFTEFGSFRVALRKSGWRCRRKKVYVCYLLSWWVSCWTSSRQKVPILYNVRLYPPKFPLPMGHLDGTLEGRDQQATYDWCLLSADHRASRLEKVPRYGGAAMPCITFYVRLSSAILRWMFVSDIAIFVLKRDVKLQLTNLRWMRSGICSLGLIRAHNPSGISIGSTVLVQMTVECPCTLQWNALSPSKLPLPMGSGPYLIHCSMGAIRVLNPNGISIGSAVLQS